MEQNKSNKSIKLDDSAMDLSTLKEIWVIVHFRDCDPGNEYEILNDACIESDSWDTLTRGVDVCVKFGNARVQGQVVVISDDLPYLQTNFKSLTEEYTSEYYGDTNHFEKKPCSVKHSVPSTNYFLEYPITKQIIKVCDKETQTDSKVHGISEERYENLKQKYNKLEEILKLLNKNITFATKEAKTEMENLAINSTQAENYNIKTEIKESHEKENSLRSRENIEVLTSKHSNRNILITDNEVFIGLNKTQILRSVFENINWHNYSGATRKLLMTVFPRNILATHTLTGKPNPAFRKNNMSTKKMRLDPSKIADIIETVTMKCHVSESLVRSAITTKCADENKMLKIRMERKGDGDTENNEPRPEIKRNLTGFNNKRLKM